MDDGPGDGKRFLLMALGAAWVMAFVYAFVAAATVALKPTDLGLGLNRISVFFNWQAIAGIIAVAVFGVGLGWEKGSVVRRFSRAPLLIAVAQVVAIVAVVVITRMN